MSTFFGWIPNVAGKLSFTLSGTAAYPRRFYHSGNLAAGGRHFAGYQHRNLSDTTLPFFSDWPRLQGLIDNFAYNKDGNFVFLCLLKVASDRESARGRIYAFNREAWSKVSSRLTEQIRTVTDLGSEEATLYEKLDQHDLAASGYSAKFAILRNGLSEITTLSVPEPETRLEHAFAAQSYFCLRDLLHVHRFHSPSTDTIIDVYPDVETLKKQVNYSLMRRAISSRRMPTVEAQQRALGIISYLRAFRENIMSERERKDLSFSIEATIASIQAGIPIIAAKEAKSLRNRLDRLRGASITFVSVLFGYAALIKNSTVLVPERMGAVRWFFEFIQQQFGVALICTVLVLFFLQVLLAIKFDKRDSILKTSSRLAIAVTVRKYGLFEILVGTILLVCALGLVAFMIHRALSGPL